MTMTKQEQIKEGLGYALNRLDKALKYSADMETSRVLCMNDSKEHIQNAIKIMETK